MKNGILVPATEASAMMYIHVSEVITLGLFLLGHMMVSTHYQTAQQSPSQAANMPVRGSSLTIWDKEF